MAKGFILSEDDRDALKRHMEEFARRYLNTRNRSPDMTIDREETVAPEVYVARTPSTGIAASNLNTTGSGTLGLYDDQPSSAECQMYQLIPSTSGSPTLRPMTDTTKTVYNVSGVAVDGNIWILAVRDKWGDWYAVAPMGQSAEEEAEEDADDCRYLTVPTKICLMYRDLPGTGTGTGSAGPTATGAPWFWLRTEYSIIDLKDRCNVVATYCVDNDADCCADSTTGTADSTIYPRWADGQFGVLEACSNGDWFNGTSTVCGNRPASLTCTIYAPTCPCWHLKTFQMTPWYPSGVPSGTNYRWGGSIQWLTADCSGDYVPTFALAQSFSLHIYCNGSGSLSIIESTGNIGVLTNPGTNYQLRTFTCNPFYAEMTYVLTNRVFGCIYPNQPGYDFPFAGPDGSTQICLIIQE